MVPGWRTLEIGQAFLDQHHGLRGDIVLEGTPTGHHRSIGRPLVAQQRSVVQHAIENAGVGAVGEPRRERRLIGIPGTTGFDHGAVKT